MINTNNSNSIYPEISISKGPNSIRLETTVRKQNTRDTWFTFHVVTQQPGDLTIDFLENFHTIVYKYLICYKYNESLTPENSTFILNTIDPNQQSEEERLDKLFKI